MKGKKHSAEQIIKKLREADASFARSFRNVASLSKALDFSGLVPSAPSGLRGSGDGSLVSRTWTFTSVRTYATYAVAIIATRPTSESRRRSFDFTASPLRASR